MSNVTMNAQFAANPAFLEYIDLLVQTQHAICRGDNQTANRLCDASEDLGQSLSLAEVKWLQWLSSDLEMLCGQELLQPVEQAEEEYARSMTQALLNIDREPERVLELLRRNRGFMSQAQVAASRARAYEILGYKLLKQEFLRCAVRLDPRNVMYRLHLVNEVRSQAELAEVLELVEETLTGHTLVPIVSLSAIGTAFMHTQSLSPVEARPVLGRLRKQAMWVFDRSTVGTLESDTAVFGLILLGRISEGLNRKSAAKEYYNQALSVDPQADEALIALGSLLVESDQEKAFSLFERAVALNTGYVLPYLVLALRELNHARYQKAIMLARQALALENSPKLCAYAHEIFGIAELGADGATDSVRYHLGEAVSLAPEYRWMRDNYEEAHGMYNKKNESQGSPQIELMQMGFDMQNVVLESDIRSKRIFKERLTNRTISSPKDESSRLARAA